MNKILISICIIMVLIFSGCSETTPVGEDISKETPVFSDEYLVGFRFGGASWGDYYDCIGVRVIICTNHDVLVFAATPETIHATNTVQEQIAKLTLTDEQYSNIEQNLNREKLYHLKIDSDKDTCDGRSYSLTLYDENEEVAKNCGAYEPTTKAFWTMYNAVMDNIPKEELRTIRNEYVERVRAFDTPVAPEETPKKNCYQAYYDYVSNAKNLDGFQLIDVDNDKTDELIVTGLKQNDAESRQYMIVQVNENAAFVATQIEDGDFGLSLGEIEFLNRDYMLVILKTEGENMIEGVTKKDKDFFNLVAGLIWTDVDMADEEQERIDAQKDYIVLSDLGSWTDFRRVNENGADILFQYMMPVTEVIDFYKNVMGIEREYTPGSDNSEEVGVYCGDDGYLYGHNGIGWGDYVRITDIAISKTECIIRGTAINAYTDEQLADITISLTLADNKYGYTLDHYEVVPLDADVLLR